MLKKIALFLLVLSAISACSHTPPEVQKYDELLMSPMDVDKSMELDEQFLLKSQRVGLVQNKIR